MTQAYEYALLAGGSYDDIRLRSDNRSPIPPGWTELTGYAVSGSGGNASYAGSGFSARVYRGPGGEIVISYAGTEFNPGSAGMTMDFLAGNLPLAAGLFSPQALAAAELYQHVLADLGTNITFTGHSLGGGLAAMMAVYFDRPAKVFAPAPFRSSVDAGQYLLGILGVLAPVRLRLFLNGQLDPALGGVPTALADYSPALDYANREGNVSVFAVKGEILESLFTNTPFPWIESSRVSLFAAGSTQLDQTNKHSIDLHVAGLLSASFDQWAARLPTALPRIFDPSLYGFGALANEQDVLVKLIRNEVGVAGTAPNGMLTHFANDLSKVGIAIQSFDKYAQDALIASATEG